ncbi:MAG TPA: ABC transporter permease, partial [Chloroflexi bacterium]|nr:ABC transporter permease [Chloroflexota bacterium]
LQARQGRSAWLQRLDGLLRTPALTGQFFAAALLVALVLGALHALTPGHGKTIVAAYLIGSRGTVGHAAFLGGVVTLTHTGSVLLLGLVALLASRAIVPSRLTPLLELASGALIVVLGLQLLWRRLRTGRSHPDHPPHAHDHTDHRSRITHHGHLHEHDHHHHHIPDPGEVTWRSLLGLGVSGGLVPCPDAIAILLIAVAIQRVLLGLLLILAFSAGLAAVLIAIGVALVTSKGLLARRFDRFAPLAQWLPVISAVVVTGLGIAVAARAVGAL